jgi:hypothetical protein
LSEARLPFGHHHTNDLARHFSQADREAYRTLLAEQFTLHRIAEQTHCGTRAHFGVGEIPPGGQLPIANLQEGIGCACDRRLPIAIAVNDLCVGVGTGRHGGYARDLFLDCLHIIQRKRWRGEAIAAATAKPLATKHLQHVGAEFLDIRLDLRGCTIANGHHGDDGGYTDYDAQNGQRGAQHIAPNLA